MGGKDSKSEGQEQDWSQFQQSAHYNQTINQAYSQRVEANYRGGEGWATGPEGRRPGNVQSQQKTLSAVKVDIDLDVKTLKLEADPRLPNVFHLMFEVNNELPVDIWVCFVAKVYFDQERTTMVNVVPKYPQDSRGLSLNPGKGQVVSPGVFPLIFSNYSFRELSRAFDDTIPVLITLEKKVKTPGTIDKVIYFCQIEQKTMTPSVISKSISINGALTSLQDVFGISKSVLKPTKETENEEFCLICFTNGINTMIQPCNHMCLCDECAQLMKSKTESCPLCRQRIESFMTLNVG